jgi:serine-type D-Ala-D-Ala carboxypeptidase/endopeptidase
VPSAKVVLANVCSLTLLATTLAAAQARPAPTPIATLVPTFDSMVQRYMQGANVPGIVYGIVRQGRLEHVGTMGVQDLDARRAVNAGSHFRIASMSKAFTALAILKLRDDGKLRLDALAEEYVPELRGWKYPTSDSPRIRVRDLVSHVGGLVTDDPWGDRQQVMPDADFTRLLQEGVPFTRAPGIAHEYSNLGYAILGRIIANVSGLPYDQYIEQQIMRPLGMTSTGYDYTAVPADTRALGYRWENGAWLHEPDMVHGAFGAMGGVQTNATDYAKWIAFLLDAWPPRDGAESGPAKRASVREMAHGLNFPWRSQRPGTSTPACTQATTYGMGLRVSQDCAAGLTLAHGGGYPGYGSYMLLLPEHGLGIFLFANRTYAGPSGLAWDIAMKLEEAGWLTGRVHPGSEALTQMYAALRSMFAAGSVEGARDALAMNFLMDRGVAIRAAEFARLKAQAGSCNTDTDVVPTGALAGSFEWRCDRGTIAGNLLLAPTTRPAIQSMGFRFVARE